MGIVEMTEDQKHEIIADVRYHLDAMIDKGLSRHQLAKAIVDQGTLGIVYALVYAVRSIRRFGSDTSERLIGGLLDAMVLVANAEKDDGMSTRDQFAAAALQALIQRVPEGEDLGEFAWYSITAFQFADLMMEERGS